MDDIGWCGTELKAFQLPDNFFMYHDYDNGTLGHK